MTGQQDQTFLNRYLIFAETYDEVAAYAAQQGIAIGRCTWADSPETVIALAGGFQANHVQIATLTSFWTRTDPTLRDAILAAAITHGWPQLANVTIGSGAKLV